MPDNVKRLTASEAEAKIREIVKYRYFTPSYHFSERMKQRGYDIQDVESILTNGNVIEAPVYKQKYSNWTCKVEGRAIEGDTAIVVTAILNDNELLCITIEPK